MVLTTLNARYIHASLGLRYLQANMGELERATALIEFTINQRPLDIVEQLLDLSPKIIGFGIYIWNVRQSTEVIELIKTIAPQITIVIGGPEVSYEYEETRIFSVSDYLITGQADLAFAQLCHGIITTNDTANLNSSSGTTSKAAVEKVTNATTPATDQLTFPYYLYSENDLKNRIIYVEASRGCPFKCEFCLSALDKTAWPFDTGQFLQQMDALYKRGARQFKFVDRTFNLKIKTCVAILQFFLDRTDNALFLHFEVIPDKLPDDLKALLKQFPSGTLQFEAGIQSFDPEVQQTISRKQNNPKSVENLVWLRQHTTAYIHADLIFGLPGETQQSFADGFNKLVELNPQEIQVGILKRLRGTAITRHTGSFDMRYSPSPPYQLLSNCNFSYTTLQRMQRFARYWDLISNSGRFVNSRSLILAANPFNRFMQLSDWIYQHGGQTHRIAQLRLMELIYLGTTSLQLCEDSEIRNSLTKDYLLCGEKHPPRWLQDPTRIRLKNNCALPAIRSTPARQSRHVSQSPQ
ncbi:B12-binding domain-containing radical SAM protein [Chromatiales bacterium (ex Bugula neritina AB1)]|nr:B12-binding domain-containing radical SAM protein [Chromatiales bacterium (ex Bugula neritina AB1)]